MSCNKDDCLVSLTSIVPSGRSRQRFEVEEDAVKMPSIKPAIDIEVCRLILGCC